MRKEMILFLLSVPLLSCQGTPQQSVTSPSPAESTSFSESSSAIESELTEESSVDAPTYQAIIDEEREVYEDLRTLSGEQRIIKAAEFEAKLRNEGILVPGLTRSGGTVLTRFVEYGHTPNSGCQNVYPHSVAFTAPIKAEDYDAMVGKGSRQAILNEGASRGYQSKDTIRVFSDLANALRSSDEHQSTPCDLFSADGVHDFCYSANRGLFYFDVEGNPVYDLAESVEKTSEGFLITIKDATWNDYEGKPLGKIKGSDFVDSYRYFLDRILPEGETPPFLDVQAKGDETILIISEDQEPLHEFTDVFNYPMPTSYKASIEGYGASIEKTVYSGYYAINENEGIITLSTADPSVIANIEFHDFYKETGNDAQGFLDDRCDFVAAFEINDEIEPFAIKASAKPFIYNKKNIALNYGVGDERYQTALNSLAFRKALLYALPKEELFGNQFSKASYDLSDTLSPLNPSLTKQEGKWLQGTSYRTIVNEHLEQVNVDECLAQAIVDLGEHFFDEPVHLPAPVYLFEKAAYLRIKEAVEETLQGKVIIDITEVQDSDFVSDGSKTTPSENRFFYIGSSYLGHAGYDVLDYAKTLMDPKSKTLSILGLK